MLLFFYGEQMENYHKLPEVDLGKYKLRTLLKKDATDFFVMGKDEETTSFLTWGPFKTLKEAKNMIKFTYFRRLGRKEPIGYAIIDTETDKLIGTIEFHTFNRKENSAEIGYVLYRPYWNQGIMTNCLKAVTEVGFNALKLDRIIIKHIKENASSQKVILKAGYKQIDFLKQHFFHPKTQRFHDVYMYEKIRRTYDK
jgi:ribosomal-protein-alanine N-acetyltransferase